MIVIVRRAWHLLETAWNWVNYRTARHTGLWRLNVAVWGRQASRLDELAALAASAGLGDRAAEAREAAAGHRAAIGDYLLAVRVGER